MLFGINPNTTLMPGWLCRCESARFHTPLSAIQRGNNRKGRENKWSGRYFAGTFVQSFSPPVSVCLLLCFTQHAYTPNVYLNAPESDAPRDTQDGWFRMRICTVRRHVLSTDFLLSCFPGKRSLTFVAVFRTKTAHARRSSVERARRELINIAYACRPRPREIDLTRLNGALPERSNNSRVLIVNRMLF